MFQDDAGDEDVEAVHDENDWGIEVVGGEQGAAEPSQGDGQVRDAALPEGLEFSMPVRTYSVVEIVVVVMSYSKV